jgi:N-acetyl-D-muramate 6-phosphate phosphatase
MLDVGRVRAVFFDMDGTLSDTDDTYVDRISRWLAPFAGLFPRRDIHRPVRRWMMATEGWANFVLSVPDRLGIDAPLASVADAIAHFRGMSRPGEFRIIPGVAGMLASLSAQYPLAVVSSRDRRGTEAFLAQFALRGNFKAIVTSLSAAHIKPSPAPVCLAAEQLNVPVENCLMVGDTPVDIVSGRRAGAQTAGVLCGFGTRADLRRVGADAILETTADLMALLSGNN